MISQEHAEKMLAMLKEIERNLKIMHNDPSRDPDAYPERWRTTFDYETGNAIIRLIAEIEETQYAADPTRRPHGDGHSITTANIRDAGPIEYPRITEKGYYASSAEDEAAHEEYNAKERAKIEREILFGKDAGFPEAPIPPDMLPT